MATETYIAVRLTSGEVAHYAFQMVGRFPGAPPAASGWSLQPQGVYARAASAPNIEYDLRKYEREQWNVEKLEQDGTVRPPVQIVAWRIINNAEHDKFRVDREYRNALRDDGKDLSHDMNHARELKRELVRHARASAMVALDAEWMKATGQEDKRAASDAEAKRQEWRDAPADARIESAQTIEALKAIALPE